MPQICALGRSQSANLCSGPFSALWLIGRANLKKSSQLNDASKQKKVLVKNNKELLYQFRLGECLVHCLNITSASHAASVPLTLPECISCYFSTTNAAPAPLTLLQPLSRCLSTCCLSTSHTTCSHAASVRLTRRALTLPQHLLPQHLSHDVLSGLRKLLLNPEVSLN